MDGPPTSQKRGVGLAVEQDHRDGTQHAHGQQQGKQNALGNGPGTPAGRPTKNRTKKTINLKNIYALPFYDKAS